MGFTRAIRTRRAFGAGVSAATAQFVLQPLPAFALGFRPQRGYLTLVPTWSSMWWLLSAAALGWAVAFGILIMRRMTLKAGTAFVASCTAFYVVANAALALSYAYGQWWDFLTVSTGLSGAVVIAALVSSVSGWGWRMDRTSHFGAGGQSQLERRTP